MIDIAPIKLLKINFNRPKSHASRPKFDGFGRIAEPERERASGGPAAQSSPAELLNAQFEHLIFSAGKGQKHRGEYAAGLV